MTLVLIITLENHFDAVIYRNRHVLYIENNRIAKL